MVLEAIKPNINCLNEICIIASFLDGKNVFVRPADPLEARIADRTHEQFKTDKDSDFVIILKVWEAYVKSGYDNDWAKANFLNDKALEEAKNVRLELIDVLESHKLFVDPRTKPRINKDAIGKAITAGLVGNLMRFTGKAFTKVDGSKKDIVIHPGSVFYGSSFKEGTYLVSDEIFMNNEGKAYASNCLVVRQDWITAVAPQLKNFLNNGRLNPKGGQKGKGKGGRRNVFDSHSRHK
jgi:HrpA-like RNA helicase